MAINKNHEFEDLEGVKCAVVERNVSASRVEFLKSILEANGFTLVVVKSPPPKAPAPAAGETLPPPPPPPETPESFTVGVTDVTFNAVNAIFGRLLKTRGGKFVTLSYWNQEASISDDEVPYFAKNPSGSD